MKIGIDARLYTQTGVGRYLRNLISQLQILDKRNEYFVYLRKKEFFTFTPANKRWHKRLLDIPWHTAGEQLRVPFYLLKDNLDVAHFPYFNVPVFYPKKYLLTIHDLIIDHFDTGRASTLSPLLYQVKRSAYKMAISIGIRRASFISVISQTTKKEVVDHYHVSSGKIIITYDALDGNFLQTLKEQKPKNYYNFPYILYVGNAYPHKNLERLVKALKIIREKSKVKLVLAGDDNYFFPRLRSYAKKIDLEKEVIFFGEAKDEELVNLYSYARCLIFPSLMEGFGLPNFEALACDCLPVISDIPVFHEIWGNKLPYFNPVRVDDMAGRIKEVLNYPKDVYKKKVVRAKKRIDDFSWKRTTEQTLKLYGNCFCL